MQKSKIRTGKPGCTNKKWEALAWRHFWDKFWQSMHFEDFEII